MRTVHPRSLSQSDPSLGRDPWPRERRLGQCRHSGDDSRPLGGPSCLLRTAGPARLELSYKLGTPGWGTSSRVGELYAHRPSQPAKPLRDVCWLCCRGRQQRSLGWARQLGEAHAHGAAQSALCAHLWNGTLENAGNAAWAALGNLAKLTPIGQPSLLSDAGRPDSNPPASLATQTGRIPQFGGALARRLAPRMLLAFSATKYSPPIRNGPKLMASQARRPKRRLGCNVL